MRKIVGSTVKPAAAVYVPSGVVTVTGPDATESPTRATSRVGSTTANGVPTPPTRTAVASSSFGPAIETTVPPGPWSGEKVGTGANDAALDPVPPGVVTATGRSPRPSAPSSSAGRRRRS